MAYPQRIAKNVTSLHEPNFNFQSPTKAIVRFAVAMAVIGALVVLHHRDNLDAMQPAHVNAPGDDAPVVEYEWVEGIEVAGE